MELITFYVSKYMNQFLSRRTFILIPTMSILKIFFKPMQVLASSIASKEDWNLSKEEWKSRLSPESYYILREEGTERAFSSELNNEKRKGVFHCAGCDYHFFFQIRSLIVALDGQVFGIQFKDQLQQKLILS